MTQIRLSPSGPVIASSGDGFRLRLEENTAANSNTPITTTGVIVVSDTEDVIMLAPKAERYYRARGRCLVRNTHETDPANLTARLQFSLDAGATWFNVGTATVYSAVAGSDVMVEVNLDKTLGSALSTPVVAQAALHARIHMTSSADGIITTVGTSTYHLEVEELL